jgi:uncharacterized protein with FMN-binding domain
MLIPTLALLVMMSCSMQHMEFDFFPYSQPENITDGEYLGEVRQGLDNAKAKVVIREGRIVEVEIHRVLAFSWRHKAVRTQLPPRFIEKQGVDIDAVSGATGSTHAVKIAVSRALEQSLTD